MHPPTEPLRKSLESSVAQRFTAAKMKIKIKDKAVSGSRPRPLWMHF